MIPDDQVGTPEFQRLVLSLVEDAGMRERMSAAAKAQKTASAARILADVVMEAAR